MKTTTIVLVLLMVMLTSFKEEENAKVILIRKGLYAGVLGDVNIFADDKIICEIKNNSFTVHNLPEGKHTFSARWSGKKGKEKAEKRGMEIEIKKGQQYYLRVTMQMKNLIQYLHIEELTENSWNNLKEGLEEDDCH